MNHKKNFCKYRFRKTVKTLVDEYHIMNTYEITLSTHYLCNYSENWREIRIKLYVLMNSHFQRIQFVIDVFFVIGNIYVTKETGFQEYCGLFTNNQMGNVICHFMRWETKFMEVFRNSKDDMEPHLHNPHLKGC